MLLAGKSSISKTPDHEPCSRDPRAPGLTARASPDLNAIMHMQSPEPSLPLCKVARRKHASVFQARLPTSSIHLPACAPSISGERPLPRSSPMPFPLRHTRSPQAACPSSRASSLGLPETSSSASVRRPVYRREGTFPPLESLVHGEHVVLTWNMEGRRRLSEPLPARSQ